MYIVYILKSLKDGRKYIGYTNNMDRRIFEHNEGLCKATKNRRPFEIMHEEVCENRTKAIKRELFFKSGKGRKYIKNILNL